MGESLLVYTGEWYRIVEKSKDALNSDCPPLEDETIVHINKHMQSLINKNRELSRVLSEIQGMCIGEIAMGYTLDANHVGEYIYSETGIKAK